MKKISVLISVFNDQEHIQEAVESCLNQSLMPDEIVVIDDGSTDESGLILDRLAQKHDIIRVFHQQNTGLTRALNRGLWLCEGEYVARLDSDDVCLYDRLKLEVEFLDSHPEYAVVGGFFFMQGKIINMPVTWEEVLQELPKRNPFAHPTVMFRRESVMEIGGYDERFRYAQDYDLWLRLLATHKGINIPKSLIERRVTTNMISAKNAQKQLLNSTLIKIKNLPISPDKKKTLKTILKAMIKLPVYTPKIRKYWRRIKPFIKEEL